MTSVAIVSGDEEETRHAGHSMIRHNPFRVYTFTMHPCIWKQKIFVFHDLKKANLFRRCNTKSILKARHWLRTSTYQRWIRALPQGIVVINGDKALILDDES